MAAATRNVINTSTPITDMSSNTHNPDVPPEQLTTGVDKQKGEPSTPDQKSGQTAKVSSDSGQVSPSTKGHDAISRSSLEGDDEDAKREKKGKDRERQHSNASTSSQLKIRVIKPEPCELMDHPLAPKFTTPQPPSAPPSNQESSSVQSMKNGIFNNNRMPNKQNNSSYSIDALSPSDDDQTNTSDQVSRISGQEENDADEEDDDEPLMSGSGAVSKDCSITDLQGWATILEKWHTNLKQRPRGLDALVKRGVPEALRAEVWQLLAGCGQDNGKSNLLMDQFRLLIAQECKQDQAIMRDINRTFPANDHFRKSGSLGQDSLYKLCKAYAVYDDDIGYCQGLSFLAAALLLHMPEEQAFCVLVKVCSNLVYYDTVDLSIYFLF